MPPFLWEILIVVALLLANGFFAGAEIAVIAAKRGRLEQQAADGDRRARVALDLASNPNRFLSTVQVGITVVGTFAAAFGGARLAPHIAQELARFKVGFLAEHWDDLALVLVGVAIAYFELVLGELVPKRLALRYAEALSRFVALPMQLLAQIARPIVWFIGLSTDLVLAVFGIRQSGEPSVQMEDIQHLIRAGTAEGLLEPAEQKLALGALELGERTVRDVMRPRIELDALDVSTPAEEVIGTIAMAGFSRLPVYEGDLDHVIGFVHIKDVFRQQYLGWPIDLRKLLHPALFVPETLPLDRLLEFFQEKETQLALVLDEFGGTEGMVTLEDVVSELVGEIRDEHHRDRAEAIVRRDDHSWLVDGRVPIDDLIEVLGLKTPEAAVPRNVTTVAGLVLDQLGRIPSVGDRTDWDAVHLEVVDMDGQRIDRLLVSLPATEGNGAAGE
ncbi:MAG: hemolysin family protein [Pirellulales bacterium]|nr:hemolysin family protein [Pirellulales bacterium]